MRRHYDTIVIGSSLLAVLYAYVNGLPLFFTKKESPFRFDYLGAGIDLSSVAIENKSQILHTPDGPMEIGTSRLILWERLIFLLSLRGHLPLANLCHKIRYDEEGIVCSDEYSKIYEFNFNTCYYCGDSNTFNIASHHDSGAHKYTCYDHIAFHRGGKHELDYISTPDEFVGEIWFYSSDRVDGNTGVKDACIVSKLSADELRDPAYSETMARFKTEKILQDHGLRGPINGYTPKGAPKYYNFKTSHLFRRTSNPQQNFVPISDKVKVPHCTEQKLLEMLPSRLLGIYKGLKCEHTLLA